MNRYRITLGILTGTFILVSILSSAIGTGLLQGFLILLAILLLIGIFVWGMVKLGIEDFWWNYFKPTAALPIAWGTLHLGFAIMFPDAFEQIWEVHRGLLIMINICAFTLNSIVNKQTDFEKRTSRWLLATTYVLLFIVSGIMMGYKLLDGKSAADMDKEISSAFAMSKIELISGKIEENNKKNKSKSYFVALNNLLEKSAEGHIFSLPELKNVERLKARIKKIYPKDNKPKTDSTSQPQPRAKRTVSAIFKLPADGTIVDCDTKGKKFHFKKGGWLHLQQLSQTGKYVWINHKMPSWSTKQKSCKTGPHTGDGIVELMSCSGRDMRIKITVK